MAHNITERDEVFAVREPMWHGLGTIFEDYPTREEAQALVHPWEPVSEPLYRAVPGFEEREHPATLGESETGLPYLEPVTRYEKVEGFQAIVRSDTGHTLGVVSESYTTVDNSELWDIAEAIESSGSDVMYETGGTLKGGSKVWLLLRLKEPLELPGDPLGATIPYYALQNSHDGSGAFRGQATMTRIVCDNTAHMADLDAKARGTEFVFRHTSGVTERIEQAKAALAGWRAGVEEWRRLSALMLNTRVTEEAVHGFVERFIPAPAPGTASDRVMHNVQEAQRTWLSIFEGATGHDVDHSVHGLVQASIEYAQHYRRAHSLETQFKRAYLDRSQITRDAVRLAWEAVNVG